MDYCIDFKQKGTTRAVYDAMDRFRQNGCCDEKSLIYYYDKKIPAGRCNNFEQFYCLREAALHDDFVSAVNIMLEEHYESEAVKEIHPENVNIDDIRGKFSLDFRVLAGGGVVDTFLAVKKYQALNLAGKDTSITFNDVCVPAGYFSDARDWFKLYTSIVSNEATYSDIIKSLPYGITDEERELMLEEINSQLMKVRKISLFDLMNEEKSLTVVETLQEDVSDFENNNENAGKFKF